MTVMPSQRLSYDLNEAILKAIGDEFSPEKVTLQFAEALARKGKNEIEKVGQEVFGNYGKGWMKRSLELGKKQSPKRALCISLWCHRDSWRLPILALCPSSPYKWFRTTDKSLPID